MLSQRLKELRLNQQLSQVDIAEKLGISNGLYNKYEKKALIHPMKYCKNFLKYMGCLLIIFWEMTQCLTKPQLHQRTLSFLVI